MFTVGVPQPTFYLLHSLYNTKHFCVMHIQTLNITVPHACYGLLLVQHYSFIHCKDVEQEASHCILRERLCVLAVPVWVLPAYLQRAQPYVNYKAVHHTRLSYTKDPLISKHGTWITSIFPSNLFTALRGFSHMCEMGKSQVRAQVMILRLLTPLFEHKCRQYLHVFCFKKHIFNSHK